MRFDLLVRGIQLKLEPLLRPIALRVEEAQLKEKLGDVREAVKEINKGNARGARHNCTHTTDDFLPFPMSITSAVIAVVTAVIGLVIVSSMVDSANMMMNGIITNIPILMAMVILGFAGMWLYLK